MKKQFAMRYDALLNGIEIVGEDLDFLCSLAEDPTEEYKIPDAVAYSAAVIATMIVTGKLLFHCLSFFAQLL